MVGFSFGIIASNAGPIVPAFSDFDFHWDTSIISTIRDTDNQTVTVPGQAVAYVNADPNCAHPNAPLLRDATLPVAPVFHRDASNRPGIRTNANSVLGTANTANWLWAGKLIALVYTIHDPSYRYGVTLSRRGMANGVANNNIGGWNYDRWEYNSNYNLRLPVLKYIMKQTVAGVASITLMRSYVSNGRIMLYLSESVDGQAPIITNHDTGLSGPLPSDASTQFPVALGGYYGGVGPTAIGRTFADITVHELVVVDGAEDPDVLSRQLRRKWWPNI
jgi:hypothetical protein